MNTTRKVVLGIGIAGSALFAAWLLTGERKKRTRAFVAKKAHELKRTLKKKDRTDEMDGYYI
jgi:multisubunit Na+/H+ antiporter MnhC subunit